MTFHEHLNTWLQLFKGRITLFGGFRVWLECAHSLVQEEILKFLNRLQLSDSVLSNGKVIQPLNWGLDGSQSFGTL